MKQIILGFFLSVAALAGTSSFAATCDSNSIAGLTAGSYPCFVTPVVFTYSVKQVGGPNKGHLVVSASAVEDPNRTDSTFYKSVSESLSIANTKFSFTYSDGNKPNRVSIGGTASDASGATIASGNLMTAGLTGSLLTDGAGTLVGINSSGIACNPDINTWLGGGGCTTNEVVYFLLDSAANFTTATKGKPISVTGWAYTSVPLPAAVWLFGSGVLGLVAVARRRTVS